MYQGVRVTMKGLISEKILNSPPGHTNGGSWALLLEAREYGRVPQRRDSHKDTPPLKETRLE